MVTRGVFNRLRACALAAIAPADQILRASVGSPMKRFLWVVGIDLPYKVKVVHQVCCVALLVLCIAPWPHMLQCGDLRLSIR
jgi:hypothetical protein